MNNKNSETIKIILICPRCGNSTWLPKDEGDFECLACGELVYPEDMCSSCEEVD